MIINDVNRILTEIEIIFEEILYLDHLADSFCSFYFPTCHKKSRLSSLVPRKATGWRLDGNLLYRQNQTHIYRTLQDDKTK